MSEQELKQRLERLRGRLGEEEEGRSRRGPGARGLERMARNSRCQLLAAVTLANANASSAAIRLGVPDRSEDASTFASGRGEKFETHIFSDDCARIRESYERAGVPLGGNLKVHDMEETFEFEERRRASEALLINVARGEHDDPDTLLLKPRLTVRLAGQEFDIEPDALVMDPDGFYRVAEIKSYADRRGYTDSHKTGSAARQAAVAVVALRQLLAAHGLDEQLVHPTADLIFSNSGSDTPTLNRLDIRGEVQNIAETFAQASATAEAVLAKAGDGTLDDPQVLRSLAPNLCDECSTHCPLWEICRADAVRARHPIVLGDGAVEVLGKLGSLDAALELLDGRRAPDDEDQATIAALLRGANDAWTEALGTEEDPYAALAAGEDQDAGLDDAVPLYGSEGEEDDEQLEVIR